MKVRKKVIAPRIVQEDPGQRLLWSVLLLAGFAIAVWLSYDFGRTRAPVSGGDGRQAREAAQRISELEQERDALQEQLEALKRDVEIGREALEAARAQNLALRNQRPAAVPARTPSQAQTQRQESDDTVDVAGQAHDRLHVENLQLESTDTENQFRYGFSVLRAGESSDRVTGTIWIAVNGMTAGKPTRLALHRISPDRRKFVKMSFELQQDVQGEVVLPPDFDPRNIMIEAKPYNEKFKGTSATYDWIATIAE